MHGVEEEKIAWKVPCMAATKIECFPSAISYQVGLVSFKLSLDPKSYSEKPQLYICVGFFWSNIDFNS